LAQPAGRPSRSSFTLDLAALPETCRRPKVGSPGEYDSLIPVKQPGDLGEDRVGQLAKRVLDGVTSDETRRAYSHALEMFLGFCAREGNPTLSAELVASYRVSLVGEGKSPSTVGVHLASIKALTRAAVMAGLMAAETAASINDVKGAPGVGTASATGSPGSRRRNCFRSRSGRASRANATMPSWLSC
jgi:hypothetical protein